MSPVFPLADCLLYSACELMHHLVVHCQHFTRMSDENLPPQRIAKAISRSGRASRREAERMIEAGRVKVNGHVISNAAHCVQSFDEIKVDDVELPSVQPTRLWRYHKPSGLVTTTDDPSGRPTVFNSLPGGLPRLVSIGRLDINSEGLLLLTNDGALKRQLEHPSSGWLRRYRVRVRGAPSGHAIRQLRDGVISHGERLGPMEIKVDQILSTNSWLTVGLRQGRNREVRRAMEMFDLQVSRLIRISFGPFLLGRLAPGDIEEVNARALKNQLRIHFGKTVPQT